MRLEHVWAASREYFEMGTKYTLWKMTEQLWCQQPQDMFCGPLAPRRDLEIFQFFVPSRKREVCCCVAMWTGNCSWRSFQSGCWRTTGTAGPSIAMPTRDRAMQQNERWHFPTSIGIYIPRCEKAFTHTQTQQTSLFFFFSNKWKTTEQGSRKR